MGMKIFWLVSRQDVNQIEEEKEEELKSIDREELGIFRSLSGVTRVILKDLGVFLNFDIFNLGFFIL